MFGLYLNIGGRCCGWVFSFGVGVVAGETVGEAADLDFTTQTPSPLVLSAVASHFKKNCVCFPPIWTSGVPTLQDPPITGVWV